jgi:acetyl-CoA C-acetyltransferase
VTAPGAPGDPIVITGARRTPIGGFQGALSTVAAPALGAAAIDAALGHAGVKPDVVDEVFMGCVLSAGVGQAPARQAALDAGLPVSASCTTVSKVCGSGMKAVMLGHDAIAAGSADIVLAGGMESMSRAPYLLDRARQGYRLGHGKVLDHMFVDGLEDAYDPGRLMGDFAEDTAAQYQFTREQQDEFALTSLDRASRAAADGCFSSEIAPIEISSRGNVTHIAADEGPTNARPEKIPQLKPAFRDDGTITAANASSISDGAAALVLMRRSEAERRGVQPLAAIAGQAAFADVPANFTTAPVGAMNKLFERSGWTTDTVDLFEINEAFAIVTMAAMRDLQIPHDKVNVHGGACALGHPIGCSGARIIVTLLAALEKYDLRRGVASLCIGGGEATAIALERYA